MRPRLVDAVCRMHPIVKMMQPVIIVIRLPMKSAMSPEMIDPKNVPADRIDTIRDW